MILIGLSLSSPSAPEVSRHGVAVNRVAAEEIGSKPVRGVEEILAVLDGLACADAGAAETNLAGLGCADVGAAEETPELVRGVKEILAVLDGLACADVGSKVVQHPGIRGALNVVSKPGGATKSTTLASLPMSDV